MNVKASINIRLSLNYHVHVGYYRLHVVSCASPSYSNGEKVLASLLTDAKKGGLGTRLLPYRSVPGKCPLPGKRPCTAFQGATVAASVWNFDPG